MPNFQSGINQLLGTGALFSQLPGGQKLAEGAKLKQQVKVLNKQAELHQKALDNIGPGTDEGEMLDTMNLARDTADQLTENKKRQFQLNPSDKTYGEYVNATRGRTQSRAYMNAADRHYSDQMAGKLFPKEEVMNRLREKGLDKIDQKKKRRNFMNYLRNEPTSFGGTVGDLPLAVQKEIAKNYTKSQRKALMDRYDRENK